MPGKLLRCQANIVTTKLSGVKLFWASTFLGGQNLFGSMLVGEDIGWGGCRLGRMLVGQDLGWAGSWCGRMLVGDDVGW